MTRHSHEPGHGLLERVGNLEKDLGVVKEGMGSQTAVLHKIQETQTAAFRKLDTLASNEDLWAVKNRVSLLEQRVTASDKAGERTADQASAWGRTLLPIILSVGAAIGMVALAAKELFE